MSMESLREALANKITDQFVVGDVIRWRSLDRYDYAAIKVGNGNWYTTASFTNSYVPKILGFNELVDILARPESTNILLASGWEKVI